MKRKLFLVSLVILVLTVLGQAAEPRSRYAELDGNRIHFLDTGGSKKDAIVFIHGWTCNADFWKGSISEFPDRRVIAVDLIGHGKSDKPTASYSMEYFARSVEAVLRKAKVDRAVLVGHSMGTPVARQFYRLYPARTLGIVIVDGAIRPFATEAQMKEFAAPLRSDYTQNAPKFLDGMLAPITDEGLKKTIRDSMLAIPGHVAISAWDGMSDSRIWTDDKINVPVLALMAPSPYWPPNLKDLYTAVAPNIDFQMWTGVSHFLMMERPKEFNDQVKAFIIRNRLL
jgi:pimeloyl-ACP methyl ester carboxylesterase